MTKRARSAKRSLTYLTGVLLAMMTSSTTMALGLGDIRVLSRPGQPLLAEIPVISADPAELENLRIGLASPATFARVGLAPPEGLAQTLQFELNRDAKGRAVIRVTSPTPVDVASVGFLVEADWGQGRLVREYSALVDTPTSARAVAEPEIAAPAAALPSTIERAPAARAASATAAAAAAPGPAPAVAAPAPTAPAAGSPVDADGRLTVQRGQTLYRIADGVARENEVARDAAMVALLRANPDAFIRGNLNLLRQGAVMRVPSRSELQGIDAAQAAILVREHAAQWRQGRVIAQPATPASGTAAAPAASAASASGARLEIAPAAAASTAQAGTTTGTGQGNEGDMLANEQLRQAREDVASRDAQIEELKQRVAELETLQKQQQSLLAMKNTELAQAQAQLAQAPAGREPVTPWYWFATPVLVLALLVVWLARRRKPSPLPRAVVSEGELAVAAPAGGGLDAAAERSLPDPADAAGLEATASASPTPSPTVAVDAGTGSARVDTPRDRMAAATVPGPAAATPADTVEDDIVPAFARHAERQTAYRGVFESPAEVADEASGEAGAPWPLVDVQTGDSSGVTDATDAPVDPGLVAAQDRLELAIAYMDLGENRTARALLDEVVQFPDAPLQARARDLLGRLS